MLQVLLPLFTRPPDVCSGCQHEYPPGSLTVETKHFGTISMQCQFCCDDCRQQFWQEWQLHLLRSAGL